MGVTPRRRPLDPAPFPARRAAALLLALLAAAALPLAWAGPEPLLAWRGGEVWGHLWTWWWHGQALPRWPPGTDLALGTERWPAIDPLPALFGAALSRLAGPALAWNLLALTGIAGAFLGGSWAARRAGGDPLVGGLALATAPAFTGSLASGLSEDLAVGLLAVAAALVLHPAQGGRRWPLAAGAALGLLAWCGPYLAFLGAGTAAVAGFAVLARAPRALPRWVLAAAVAALLALPPLLLQGERALSGDGHRTATVPTLEEPLWRVNPWGAADLASYLVPGPAEVPGDAVVRLHPAYLGLLVLALAAAGGRSRWWWVLLAVVLVAPGEQLRLLGHPTGIPNPFAQALDLAPLGARLNHHARLLLLAQVALAVLAARGARGLGRWAPLALLAVAADHALLAPLPWPLATASAAPQPISAALGDLPPGGVLVVPMGGPGVAPQRPLLDQRAHGRRLALDPNRPGPPPWMAESALGTWLAALGRLPDPAPPGDLDPGALLSRGYPVLLAQGPARDEVERLLGPPQLARPAAGAWDLSRLRGRARDSLPPEPGP